MIIIIIMIELFIQKNLRKIIQNSKKGQNMVSELSWGPCMVQGLLKWTEIGPTNDPWMIWYEVETFCNGRFWHGQTKTGICIQEDYLFLLYRDYSFKINIHFLRNK